MSVITYFQKHINQLVNASFYVDTNKVDSLVNMIFLNTYNLFFTGIGKNSHIAAKTASTFCSIGIPAFYIDATDAMHGDLGSITKNDILVAITKSGNTPELLSFLQQIKSHNLVLLHSNNKCLALTYSNLDIYIPCPTECDDLNIIPTASIIIFTTFLQSIACELAHQKNLSITDFIASHPGGTIGKITN